MHATDDLVHRSGLVVARAAARAEGSTAVGIRIPAGITVWFTAREGADLIEDSPTYPEQMDRWTELHRPARVVVRPIGRASAAPIADPDIARIAALAEADASLAREIERLHEDDGA